MLTRFPQIFGNSTSVPLSLVTSLSQTLQGLRWDKVPGDNAQKVTARGILYLLIFQQLGLLLRWSWGYNVLLAPPYKLEEEDDYAISTIEQGQRVYRDEPEPEQEQWQDQEQQQGQEQEQQPELEQELEPEDGLTPWGSNRTRPSFLHQFRNGSIDGIEDVSQVCRRESRTESDHGSERMIRRHREPLESEAVPTAETRSYPTAEPQVAPAAVIMMTVGGTNGSTTSGPNMPAGGTDGSITSGSRTRPPTFRTDKQSATGLKTWPIRTREAVKRGVSRIFSWMRVVLNKIFRLLPDPMRTVCTKIFTGTNYFLRGLWGFMNPPLFAILIAILVALIPSLQKAFFTEGTFIKNAITSAISRSGDVAVPLILVVLGANLAKNTIAEEPKHSTGGREAEDRKLLIASLVSRMVLPTIVMVPLLALIVKELNISVLGDPIFIVVCCLLSGAPSALQLAQICQINGVYVSVMSDLLFQSYVVWYVSIGVCVNHLLTVERLPGSFPQP